MNTKDLAFWVSLFKTEIYCYQLNIIDQRHENNIKGVNFFIERTIECLVRLDMILDKYLKDNKEEL